MLRLSRRVPSVRGLVSFGICWNEFVVECGCSDGYPKGPRTQIIGFQGPNTIVCFGIWALKPYYLGPWTLRVRV